LPGNSAAIESEERGGLGEQIIQNPVTRMPKESLERNPVNQGDLDPISFVKGKEVLVPRPERGRPAKRGIGSKTSVIDPGREKKATLLGYPRKP